MQARQRDAHQGYIMNAKPPPSQPLLPLKIEIKGVNSARFKSIGDLTWEAIPPFAVLTGLNGSGKTQLLELLALNLTRTQPPQYPSLHMMIVTIEGDRFDPDTVAYLPSSGVFSVNSASLALGKC
jgi:ABC-type molybdenum transport system ATPase subunit/photorepair protein PhrA